MSLTSLPVELLLDNLLPLLSLQSLLALTCTSKFFADVCQDQILWKRKLQGDYNFSSTSEAARTSGFKTIYKGIRHPRVFVWGHTGQGRLGLGETPSHVRKGAEGISYPVELHVDARIVSIVGGGWSFHALDDQGNLHVWGQLEGFSFGLRSDPFSEPSKMVPTPHLLKLDAKMTLISCGRAHATSLDTKHQVWVFTNWGRPCILTSPLINSPEDQHTAIQVEAGWSFVSILTRSGSVYAVWPFEGEFFRVNRALNKALDEERGNIIQATNGVVPCKPIDINVQPLLLPDLPDNLPPLGADVPLTPTWKTEQSSGKPKLVKIAAGDNFIIGLTDGGHVLSIDVSNGGAETHTTEWLGNAFAMKRREWTYLPHFSDVRHLRDAPPFGNVPEGSSALQAPASLHITHVSAHFNSFTAYAPNSGSVVLMGSKTTEPSTGTLTFERDIPASLQNRGIIAVILGDYHYGALTSEGALFTWGRYSAGALGIGDPRDLDVGVPGGYASLKDKEFSIARRMTDPPEVSEPTEVRFDWHGESRRSFCFAATAAGWHTAALLIDLDGKDPHWTEQEDTKSTKMPGDYPFPANQSMVPDGRRQGPLRQTLPTHPFDPPSERNPHVPIRPTGPMGLPVRIGLAGAMGRGLNPGNGRGAGGSHS